MKRMASFLFGREVAQTTHLSEKSNSVPEKLWKLFYNCFRIKKVSTTKSDGKISEYNSRKIREILAPHPGKTHILYRGGNFKSHRRTEITALFDLKMRHLKRAVL